jgi:hypothetical protein
MASAPAAGTAVPADAAATAPSDAAPATTDARTPSTPVAEASTAVLIQDMAGKLGRIAELQLKGQPAAARS